MIQQTINFKSAFDGTDRGAVILAPSDHAQRTQPLMIVSHAAGYSAEDTAAYWGDLPSRRGFIAVFPVGHGRKLDLYSFGWQGQISDLAQMPEIVDGIGYKVDPQRIFAAGVSMGAQESLLLAGMYPELISGVAAFSALTDLGLVHAHEGPLSQTIEDEAGGAPDALPEDYALRSPISFHATISRVPTLLCWDPNDEIVPAQSEDHSGKLYRAIKTDCAGCPISARKRKYGHFWMNPGQAMRWLMENYRR